MDSLMSKTDKKKIMKTADWNMELFGKTKIDIGFFGNF